MKKILFVGLLVLTSMTTIYASEKFEGQEKSVDWSIMDTYKVSSNQVWQENITTGLKREQVIPNGRLK